MQERIQLEMEEDAQRRKSERSQCPSESPHDRAVADLMQSIGSTRIY